MRKVQCSGSSAAFNQTPRLAASSAIAEWTATDPVAANAIAAPARSPLRYARRATVRRGSRSAHAVISSDTSGAITVTVAPVCSSVSTFRAATSPPPTTTQTRDSRSTAIGRYRIAWTLAQAARALPRARGALPAECEEGDPPLLVRGH
jgi:hypothetical protein